MKVKLEIIIEFQAKLEGAICNLAKKKTIYLTTNLQDFKLQGLF